LVRVNGRVSKCDNVEPSSWIREARDMVQQWKLFIRERQKRDLIICRTEHWDSPLWRNEVTRVVKRWNSVVDLVTLTKAPVSCTLKLLPQMDRPGMLRWAEGVVIDLKKLFFLRLVSQTIPSQSFYIW